MKDIIIYTHLGLGDHIICNGLVRELYKKYQDYRIYIACKPHNIDTVSFMYSDLERISILPYSENIPIQYICPPIDIIKLGFEKMGNRSDFDVCFYDCAGIDFKCRNTSFYFPEDKLNKDILKKINHKDDFILIHNTSSESKYNISIKSNLKHIYVEYDNCFNLFDWLLIAKKSKEIHCVGSSFLHLINLYSSKLPNIKRVFHDIRKTGSYTQLNEGWEVINYDNN